MRFQDLRYAGSASAMGRGRGRRTLGAAVKLDKNLRVIGDVYGTDDHQIIVPEPGSRK